MCFLVEWNAIEPILGRLGLDGWAQLSVFLRRTDGPQTAGKVDSYQFLKFVYNSTLLILSWFLCQTFGGVIKFDCCHWSLWGPEGEGTHSVQLYNSTFLILSWFLCQKPSCPPWKTDSWAPTSVRGPTVRGPIGPSISWWCLGLLGLLGLWASHDPCLHGRPEDLGGP